MYKSALKFLIFVFAVLFCSFGSVSAQKKSSPKSPTKPVNTPKSSPVSQKTNTSAKIELEILDEINLLRSNPQTFIQILEDLKNGIKNNVVILPNGTKWQMNEGTPALDDAIKSLKATGKLKPFLFSNGLAQAANMQLADLQENMSLGHFGKDGGDVESRIIRFGIPGERYSENISYHVKDVRSAILIMIIDDGLKSRNHRKNLLSAQFSRIGTAFGKTPNDVGLCIVVFADEFTEISK